MKQRVLINAVWLMFLLGLIGMLQGCGGGGGSAASGSGSGGSGGGSAIAGIALPTEVSAVSASSGSGAPAASVAPTASLAASIRDLAQAASDLPANSDYVKTRPAKFVDEPTLQVFGIIETILKATAQTNYADAENIGAGPYKAVVAWYEDQNGQSVKDLEEWVVDSDMVNGVNEVKVWIDDPQEPVSVSVAITSAPTQDADGNYLDYGEWSILANVDGGVFFADATIVDGQTQLRLSEDFTSTENVGGPSDVDITERTKAILIKSPVSGYGKALIADREYCWDTGGGPSPCADPAFDGVLPQFNVQYAYNQDTLALQVDEDNDGTPDQTVYKDRSDPAEIYYRYGLFDAETGQNVEKVKQFGFPVVYNDGTSEYHGFYGAWQGRHQLWIGMGDGGPLPNGSTVTEEVWDNSTPRTFTTAVFNGTLTKRTLVAGQLSQVQDIPVEIWMSDHFDLKYDSTLNSGAGGWEKCTYEFQGLDPDFGFEIWNENCSTEAFDMTQLVFDAGSRKMVDIGGQFCDSYSPPTNCIMPQVEVQQDGSLVESQFSQNPGAPLVPNDGASLWVNVNGSTYIVYNGTAWVEKVVVDFDENTWTPTFASADNDIPFDFPIGREYYINNKGTNFVVKRTDTGYDVSMEVQSVVRPDNYATVLSGVDHFAYEWEDSTTRSTFVFDPATMTLKYDTVGSNDSNSGAVSGDILQQGGWGLTAFDSGDNKIVSGEHSLQFNWEYATQDNPWGAVTYLVDNANPGVYVLLDDPVMLDPLELGGQTYSLQFDGWMHGLPDMHWELQKNDYMLDDSIRDKIVNIPAGTLVTDSTESPAKDYYVKPLEIGVILPTHGSAPAGAPDPGNADSLNLNFTVPTPVDIGAMPTDVVTKYVEGKPVE